MSRMACYYFVLSLILGAYSCATRIPTIEELSERSRMIFTGTIEQLGGSTVPQLPPSDRSVIVRVDHILQGSKLFRHFLDDKITIYLNDNAETDSNVQYLFFCNGWLYGKSIAVREVGHIRAPVDISKMQAEIVAATLKKERHELSGHLRKSKLVIMGTVVDTFPANLQAIHAYPGEHNPAWRTLLVKVESVLVGKLRADSLIVGFAASRDVMWYKSPKPVPSQRGIWVLHNGADFGARDIEYVVVHSNDYLGSDSLDEVKAVLDQ